MGFIWTDQNQRALLAPPVEPDDSLDFLDTKKSNEGCKPLLTRILVGGFFGMLVWSSAGCTQVEFEPSKDDQVACEAVGAQSILFTDGDTGPIYTESHAISSIIFPPECTTEAVAEVRRAIQFENEKTGNSGVQPDMIINIAEEFMPPYYIANTSPSES